MQFDNLFGETGELLQSGLRHEEAVLHTDGSDTRNHEFGLQGEDHVGLQELLGARGQYRQFVDLQANAVTDELGLLLRAHESAGIGLFL